MIELIVEGKRDTPRIEMLESGVFTMSGRSIPEDSDEFYQPICYYIERFCSYHKRMIFNFEMDYYNTLSMRYLSRIFSIINKSFQEGKDIMVNWYYRHCDENMQEMGEGYKDIYKFKFNLMLM